MCPSQRFSVIGVNGSDPPTQCTTTTIEIYSSMSHLCIAEQTVRQVAQTKRGTRPLFLLHITRGSVSMARCHGLPWVSQLFLMWQGHRELEFGCRQQMRTSSLSHQCLHTHVSSISHQHEKKALGLIRMKKLCQAQLPLEQYRDAHNVCSAVRQALFGQRLLWNVLLCVKAQRCSNYAQLICASMFWGDKGERFSFSLHYSGVLTRFLDVYDCCTTYMYSILQQWGRWIEGDPDSWGLTALSNWLLLMNDKHVQPKDADVLWTAESLITHVNVCEICSLLCDICCHICCRADAS